VSRYRAVFAVFLVPFAGLAVAAVVEALRERRWRRALALAAAAAAIGCGTLLLERQVVFAHQPADFFRYRPAEFILSAQVYAGRGDLQNASRELLLLARLNPRLSDKINAHLMLAELGARSGSLRLARAALDAAAGLGRRDAFALMAVGDAYLSLLRDGAAARTSYEAAQRVDRSGRLAGILRQRLAAVAAGRGEP
jgi:hypothetical protein